MSQANDDRASDDQASDDCASDDQAALDRFRQWLDQTRAEADSLPAGADLAAEPPAAETVGFLPFVEEFTALRHEVKLNTKSCRGLIERAEASLAAMREAVDAFRGVEAKETEAGRRAARPVVHSLMELDEALRRGLAVIEAARRRALEELGGEIRQALDELMCRLPFWRRWLCRAWCRKAAELLVRRTAILHRDFFDSLSEGYQLILGRLERAMKEAELYRIDCVGKLSDPNLMTVVEVVDDPLRPPGVVLDEVRPGYYWQGKVLRFAEVRAVRA